MTAYDRVGTPAADGQYLDDLMSTDEVLEEIGFAASPQVFAVVVSSFSIENWVEAPDGIWGTLPLNRELDGAWLNFCNVVRHRTRFHFHRRTSTHPEDGIQPADMLSAIGHVIRNADLVKEIPPGREFFRGRVLRPNDSWSPDANNLGAPPESVARSGRMNPTGIPYLYLAFELDTALAEMGPLEANEVIPVAIFRSEAPLRIVDFTDIPPIPSLFDPEHSASYDQLAFLRSFVDEISQPVDRQRLPDIHYVPTQVMSEYLAQGFETTDDRPLDGVMYPSAARPRGRNIALFPSRATPSAPFGAVAFAQALTWAEVLERALLREPTAP
ncbi:RES domain-containing protein [Variovorax sp. ZS18.2.2]|uniref:RES domain-containing protein n=1 Tax=Variovorax sp. ZS18.2.2 TaxID=2971255 RepID=UPI002151B035|nr:RES domain-containing protein [Variovorax sp. ZS18.2.2]MCR6480850.1 RES domain-containing protein [Variovorax sp. ZS18.2.2]